MNQFELENRDLLNSFLTRKFLAPGKERAVNIEWFLSADCDQKCSYCYLQNQKDGLYPKEFRKLSTIVKNAKIVLDWMEEKELQVNLHIFTGEFFNLGETTFEILDMFFTHCSDNSKKCKIKNITIPTNMSFILDEEKTLRVEQYMDKFMSIGVRIGISASIDGKYLEKQTRPTRRVDKRDDDFYERVFKFLAKYECGLHPMVASYGIENWIENYKWFMDLSRKYLKGEQPMMLEVRDNDWTDESIDHFLELLDYIIEDEFQNRYNGNKKAFAKRIFIKPVNGYDNIALPFRVDRGDRIGCMIQDCLYIRIGDLSIVPCHRLSYDQFNYGKLIEKEGKITDIEAGNIYLMTAIHSTRGTNLPICEKCDIAKFCTKGCLGSQYETSREPLLPNDSVCNLYKRKIDFLLKKYYEMGVLHELQNLNIDPRISKEINAIARKRGY